MTLRDYQLTAISEARALIRSGKRAPVIISPTGTGKTMLGSEIARLHVDQGGRVLWLAHRAELVDQAAAALERAGLGVGVIAASSSRRPQPHARVQVASTQTLLSRDTTFVPTLIIQDETHHYVADEWGALATRWPDALRVGLTATPERADGAGLGAQHDCIVVATTVSRAIAEGYLAPVDVVCPDRALAGGEIAQHPLDAYLEHARGRQAVVFAPHLKAAGEYEAAFAAAGIRAGLVWGEQRAGDRVATLARYDRGALDVLLNVAVLTEGWDHPPTGVAILARGCGSPGLYIQIAGRILRPHPSKERATLIDLRGVVHIHGRPDEDRVYSLDGRGIRRTEELGPEKFCVVCGALIEPPATVCAACGHERPPLESPTVVGAPLRRYARDVLAKDDESKRIERLARWMADAAARGHKPGAALHKFKACYSRFPTWDEQQKAKAS